MHEVNTQIGYRSLGYFTFSLLLFSSIYLTDCCLGIVPKVWGTIFWGPILYFSVINIFLKLYLQGFVYDVAIRSTFLGCAFATGVYLSLLENGWRSFGLYTCVMSFFHFSEFFSIAMSNPESLSLDSFILNQSIQYGIAAVTSWIEFAVEIYFFPDMKKYFWISLIGFIICVGGELMRKGAMFTAKKSFNHCIQFVKCEEHTLVTHGVYSICRHPSYAGWFYWSIGTQIILLNPVCVVAYALASWSFFRERVYVEEITLIGFFGDMYKRYQKCVPTGLPFIKGYV